MKIDKILYEGWGDDDEEDDSHKGESEAYSRYVSETYLELAKGEILKFKRNHRNLTEREEQIHCALRALLSNRFIPSWVQEKLHLRPQTTDSILHVIELAKAKNIPQKEAEQIYNFVCDLFPEQPKLLMSEKIETLSCLWLYYPNKIPFFPLPTGTRIQIADLELGEKFAQYTANEISTEISTLGKLEANSITVENVTLWRMEQGEDLVSIPNTLLRIGSRVEKLHLDLDIFDFDLYGETNLSFLQRFAKLGVHSFTGVYKSIS